MVITQEFLKVGCSGVGQELRLYTVKTYKTTDIQIAKSIKFLVVKGEGLPQGFQTFVRCVVTCNHTIATLDPDLDFRGKHQVVSNQGSNT